MGDREMEPLFFEEEEEEEEFEDEMGYSAKAFILYSKYSTFDEFKKWIEKQGIIISGNKNGDRITSIEGERQHYDLKIENKYPFVWKFSTREIDRTPFKKVYNALNRDVNVFTPWLPSKYLYEAKENFKDIYRFEPTRFSLKYRPYHIADYTKITLSVWSRNAEKYNRLLKEAFEEKLGIQLKEYYSQSMITSLNPSKTGQVYIHDDLKISQTNGNCYDVFDDISSWGNDTGSDLLKIASKYSWFEIKPDNPSSGLVERGKKRALKLTFDPIEKDILEEFTEVSSLGKLYKKYFSPKKIGDKVRFPEKFITTFIEEEYKNQIILRLVDFKKGETIIMDINEDDWSLQLYPTDLTNPWTVINICKEIYNLYPLEVRGFP